MAAVLAGEAAVRIVPTLRNFHSEVRKGLKAQPHELVVKVKADTKPADAEMDAWRARQSTSGVKVPIRADFQSFQRDLSQVEHIFKRSSISKAIRINLVVLGLDALPALAYAAGSAASGLDALAKSSLALPGILGGALSAAGALATGIHGVKDALQAYSQDADKATENARKQQDADRELVSAKRNLQSAIRDQKREMEDLNAEMRRSSLSEADAILSIQEDMDRLRQGGFRSITEYQRAQLQLLQDTDHLSEVRRKNNRTIEDANKANAEGVQGSDKVSDALDRVAKATEALDESKITKVSDALAKLSPNAQATVKTLHDLTDEWKKLVQTPVQDKLFEGVDQSLKELGGKTLPVLGAGLTGVASGLNTNLKAIASSLGSDKNTSLLTRIFGNTQGGLQNASKGVDSLIHSILQLTSSSSSFLPRLGDAAEKVFAKFDAWTSKISADGSLNHWIDNGLKSIDSLGRSVGKVAHMISEISRDFDAASGHSGGFVQSLENELNKLNTKVNEHSNEIISYFRQAKDFTGTLTQAFRDAKPFIHDLIQAARDWSTVLVPVAGSLASLAAMVERNTGLVKPLVAAYLTFSTVRPVIEGLTGAWKTYSTVMDAVARQGGAGGVVSGAFNNLKTNMASLGGANADLVRKFPALAQVASDVAPPLNNSATAAGAASSKIKDLGTKAGGAAGMVAGGSVSLLGAVKNLAGYIGPGLAFVAAVAGAEVAITKLGQAHEKSMQQAQQQESALRQLNQTLDETSGAATRATTAQVGKNFQNYSIPANGDHNNINDAARRLGLNTEDLTRAAADPAAGDLRNSFRDKFITGLTKQVDDNADYQRVKGLYDAAGISDKDIALAMMSDPSALAKYNAFMSKMNAAVNVGGLTAFGTGAPADLMRMIQGEGTRVPTLSDYVGASGDLGKVGFAFNNSAMSTGNAAQANAGASQSTFGKWGLNDAGRSLLGAFNPDSNVIVGADGAHVTLGRAPTQQEQDILTQQGVTMGSPSAGGGMLITLPSSSPDIQRLAGGGFKTNGPNDSPLFSEEGEQYYGAAFAHNSPFAKPSATNYQTALTGDQEKKFREWVKVGKIPFDPNAAIVDYDMRGFWAAGGERAHGDFEDRFKTPYDTTFSAESQYATGDNPFKWQGEDYWQTAHGAPHTGTLFDTRTGSIVFGRQPPGIAPMDVPGMATGGLVKGVGGPTDDMNLVAMSTGEHVAKAKAVDYYGPKLFDDLNNMRIPKHAMGGWQDWRASIGIKPPLPPFAGGFPSTIPGTSTPLPQTVMGPVVHIPPPTTIGQGSIGFDLGGAGTGGGALTAGGLRPAPPVVRAGPTGPPPTAPPFVGDPILTRQLPHIPVVAPTTPAPPPLNSVGGIPPQSNSAFNTWMSTRNGFSADQRAAIDEYWRGRGFDVGSVPGKTLGGSVPHTQAPTSNASAVPLGNTPIYSGIPGINGPVIAPSGPVMGQMRGAIDSLVGTPYVWGGWSPAGIDCSGLASLVSNIASGRPAWSSRFDTHSELGALTERGFLPGKGGQGMLTIGWNDSHTAITLPDGTAVSSGENGGVQYGGGGSNEGQFSQWMHLPVDAGALDQLGALGIPGLGAPGGAGPAFLQPKNIMSFLAGQAQNVGSGLSGIGLGFLQGATGINLGPLLGDAQNLGNGAIGALGQIGGPGGGTELNAIAGQDMANFLSGGLPVGSAGGAFSPGGGAEQYRPLVRRVLQQLGPQYGITNTKAWEDAIIKQIGTESGGNAKSFNSHDPNGAGGTQTVAGILNFRQDTFNANNVTGGSYMDPAAQIAAAIPYVKNKYGINEDGSPKGIGLGHGFKAGGFPDGSALVSPGEFITNKKAISYYGPSLYNALNSMSLPKKFMGGFAKGGFAGRFEDGGFPDPLAPPPPPSSIAPGAMPNPIPAPKQTPGPLSLGQSAEVPASTGGPPGPGATAPAPDPGALPQVSDALAGLAAAKGGPDGGVPQPGANPSDQADPRATLGAAPQSQDHNLPAVSQGIQGAAGAIGSIAAMAAQMGITAGTMGAGAPAGGAAAQGIQAGAQMAGAIATGAVNILSSLMVGTATPGSTAQASGVPLLPQRQPMQTGVPVIQQRVHNGDIHVTNMDQFKRTNELMDAQNAMPYISSYGA